MLRRAASSVLVLALVVATAPRLAAARADRTPILVEGRVAKDKLLRRNRSYLLRGVVVVAEGATLRIAAGARVLCEPGSLLVVERGARIRAVGTAALPIVFTSARPENLRSRGEWGGIVVNGYAPAVGPAGTVTLDDGTGSYGGLDALDTSGELRYVRIEYAGGATDGRPAGAALALRGVGKRTVVDCVETLNAAGDGLAIAGGTVDVRHVVSVGNGHGGLVWSAGWNGNAQFLVIQQRGDLQALAYSGLSADTNVPKLANATLVGGPTGIRLSEGARGAYTNVVVLGCSGPGLDIRDTATVSALVRGDLAIDNAIFWENLEGANFDGEVRSAISASGRAIVEEDPALVAPFDEVAPDFRPRPGSPTLDPVNVAPVPEDAFFTQTTFVGAVGPEPGDDWTAGWTSFDTPPAPRYLANARRSPVDVASAFLAALAADDRRAIERLRITKSEFCFYVWPELPASRLPNVTCDFAWSQATLNSLSGLGEVLAEYRAARFQLVSLRFAGGSERHDSFTVHYDTRVTVRDDAGVLRELKLFGSMLELGGQFKLFSFVVD